MTPSLKNATKSSFVIAAVIAGIALVGQSGSADAVSLAVKRACKADYFAHCSHHAVGTPGVRRCMRDAGPQLSKPCVNALIAAGEVSKAEVARREARR
ncbi:MAG: hypothetical protein ACK5KM_04155 [Hyphomicrobiaceae bacterium]